MKRRNEQIMKPNPIGELHDHPHFERESCKSEPKCEAAPDRDYTITCTATITVPANAVEITAYSGHIIGFRLMDGSVIKPWIAIERQRGETYRDLNEGQLAKLDVVLEQDDRYLEEIVA